MLPIATRGGAVGAATGPLVVAIGDSAESIIRSAGVEPSERHFDLVEARLDLVPEHMMDQLGDASRQLESSGTGVIANLRRRKDGGQFGGTADEYFVRLREAMDAMSWVEVEYQGGADAEVVARVADLIERKCNGRIIVSYTERSRMPPLTWLVEHVGWMRSLADVHLVDGRPAERETKAIVKIAAKMTSEMDLFTLMQLAAAPISPVAVVGIGGTGEMQLEMAGESLLAYGYLHNQMEQCQVSVESVHAKLLRTSSAYALRHTTKP